MDSNSYLRLEEQLCFPIYATSRMITRLYQPYLQAIDLTYPQYLVMLVLWEESNLTVGQLGKKLFLNTNTLTPLLNKMKEKGLLLKNRNSSDERTVEIKITEIGKKLKSQAEKIPHNLLEEIKMEQQDLLDMQKLMWKFLKSFDKE